MADSLLPFLGAKSGQKRNLPLAVSGIPHKKKRITFKIRNASLKHAFWEGKKRLQMR